MLKQQITKIKKLLTTLDSKNNNTAALIGINIYSVLLLYVFIQFLEIEYISCEIVIYLKKNSDIIFLPYRPPLI